MVRVLPPLLLLLGLGGCDTLGVLVGAGVGGASVVLIGRTPGDAVVSAIRGQDCSVVRLDRGQRYCAPVATGPEPPPFCTPSLGRIDCWTTPPLTVPPVRGVADAQPLTAAQEADLAARWPYLR